MQPSFKEILTSDPRKWDEISHDLHQVNIMGPWEEGANSATRVSVTRHSKGFGQVTVSPYVDYDAGEPCDFGFKWTVRGRDIFSAPKGEVSAPYNLIGLFVNGDPMNAEEARPLFEQAQAEADSFLSSKGWLLQ